MPDRKSFLASTGLLGAMLLAPGLRGLQLPPGGGSTAPLLAKPALENSYWYIGHLLSVLLRSADTNGLFSLLKMTEVKGLEPPPHTHTREDEIFLLLDGEITFSVDGGQYHAAAGDCMYLPKNMEHSFKVVSDRSEVLILLTPGGFEQYFIEMSTPAPELKQPPLPAGPPDIAKLVATSLKYGVKFPAKPGA